MSRNDQEDNRIDGLIICPVLQSDAPLEVMRLPA